MVVSEMVDNNNYNQWLLVVKNVKKDQHFLEKSQLLMVLWLGLLMVIRMPFLTFLSHKTISSHDFSLKMSIFFNIFYLFDSP